MAAAKKKASGKSKAPVSLTIEEGYRVHEVTVVPSESITIKTQAVRPSATETVHVAVKKRDHARHLVPGTPYWAGTDWLMGRLSQAQREELGAMLHDGLAEIAADWVEDHGGEREWVEDMEARERPADETYTHEVTYRVGDMAEWGSYNLSYYGEIVSITAKTVTIKKHHDDETRRLKIAQFLWRNWSFSIEKARKRNAEWQD